MKDRNEGRKRTGQVGAGGSRAGGLGYLVDLTFALSKRDVLMRYRGSVLGLAWSFISPLSLLIIYTFVFGAVMKNKWPGAGDSIAGFAIMLFCGLIPFNFINESLSRGSQSIIATPNFVKRIAFPTQILPIVAALSALVHALISLLMLLGIIVFFRHSLPLTSLLAPVVMLPLVIMSIAGGIILATVGVFIRDIGHLLGVVFSMLLFASPIFYPASMFPARLQWLVFINPIAYGASNLRKVMVLGEPINLQSWLAMMVVGGAGLILALAYHRRLRERFSDVL